MYLPETHLFRLCNWRGSCRCRYYNAKSCVDAAFLNHGTGLSQTCSIFEFFTATILMLNYIIIYSCDQTDTNTNSRIPLSCQTPTTPTAALARDFAAASGLLKMARIMPSSAKMEDPDDLSPTTTTCICKSFGAQTSIVLQCLWPYHSVSR